VQRVEVSDVSGPDAGAIVAALERAARGTSTLDVNMAALRGAVSRFPQVRSLSVRAVFPHQLRIDVIEQLPVAVLDGPGGLRAAAAADGAVLGPSLVASDLPTITVPRLATKVVHDSTALESLRVLGAAPPSLVAFVANVSDGPKGITASLRDGMLVYFGDASRAHAKWLAFARVLVAEGSATATYIDVRLPERPAVGGSTASLGSAELTELGGATAAATAQAASAGTSASLIAALEAALGTAGASTDPATVPPSATAPTEAGPSPTVAAEASAPGAEPNTTNMAAAPATVGAAEAQVPASAQPGG
jgi:cell division septal protein FtsQ